MSVSTLSEKFNSLRDVTADESINEYAVTDHSRHSRTALKKFIHLGKEYVALISEQVDELYVMEENSTEEVKQGLYNLINEEEFRTVMKDARLLVKAIKAKVIASSRYFIQAYNRTKNSPAFEEEMVEAEENDVEDESDRDSIMVDLQFEEEVRRVAAVAEGCVMDDTVIEVPVTDSSPLHRTNFTIMKDEPDQRMSASEMFSTNFPRRNITSTVVRGPGRLLHAAPSPVRADFRMPRPTAHSTAVPKEEVPSWAVALIGSFTESQHCFAESQRSNNLLIQHLISRQPTESTTNTGGHQGPRMKEISLPAFSGEQPEEWDGWWSMFKVMVDSSNMTYAAKMITLKSYVTKIARDAISSLPLSKEGYNMACELLIKRFTFEGKCRNYPLENLRTLATSAVPDNGKSLMRLYYNQYSCLQQLKMKVSLADELKYWVKKPYPDSLQDHFASKEVRFVQKHDVPMPIDEFMDMVLRALQVHAARPSRSEEIQKINNAVEDRQDGEYESFKNPNHFKKEDRICCLCDTKGHFEHYCMEFRTLEDRMRIVEQKSLCQKCFSNRHTVAVCTRGLCPKCGEEHGMAVCPLWQDLQRGPAQNFRG